MYWLLFYDLVDDYLERRTPLRPAHLELAQEAHARGELLMAGALADPPDIAVLVLPEKIRPSSTRSSTATRTCARAW